MGDSKKPDWCGTEELPEHLEVTAYCHVCDACSDETDGDLPTFVEKHQHPEEYG